jgi:hypothetical protein
VTAYRVEMPPGRIAFYLLTGDQPLIQPVR